MLPDRDKLILNTLISLIGLVGFVGNLLILRSLIMYKNMRITHHVVIGGLALASILYIIFEIPQNIVNFTDTHWNISELWCNITNYMAYCSLTVIAFHLVVLTVLNALILTNRPNAKITSKHGLIIVIFLFLFIYIIGIPLAFAYEVDKNLERCILKPHLDARLMMLLTISMCYIVPLSITIVTYIILHYITKRFFEDSIPLDKRRLSQLVLGLVMAYFLCQLPYYAVSLHVHFNLGENTERIDMEMWIRILSYFLCLAQLSFSIGPVVCAKLSKDFGDSFDEIINCTACLKDSNQRSGINSASTPLTCSTIIASENIVWKEIPKKSVVIQKSGWYH